jgi:ferritin-like metal-binding protein YciE
MKKQIEHSAYSPEMENSALLQLFRVELRDMYWGEKHLVQSLADMAKAASCPALKKTLEDHVYETEEHVDRLEMIFEILGEKVPARKCDAMEGLIEEANKRLKETEEGSMVRNVAIIACAQKIEHYEIATYGTLQTLAEVMEQEDVADLLMETLKEEKNANNQLTDIAELQVNAQAKVEQK